MANELPLHLLHIYDIPVTDVFGFEYSVREVVSVYQSMSDFEVYARLKDGRDILIPPKALHDIDWAIKLREWQRGSQERARQTQVDYWNLTKIPS